jgi:hypothetical protein
MININILVTLLNQGNVTMENQFVVVVRGEKGVTVARSEIQRFYYVAFKDEGACELVLKNGDRLRADCDYLDFRKCRLGLDQ